MRDEGAGTGGGDASPGAWIDVDFDLGLLRTFIAVADARSFTDAARRRHLTQSAVSLHVKRLEDLAGAKLLARTPRGASLTPEGEVLLAHARRITAEVSTAFGALRAPSRRTDLRVAVPEDALDAALTEALRHAASEAGVLGPHSA